MKGKNNGGGVNFWTQQNELDLRCKKEMADVGVYIQMVTGLKAHFGPTVALVPDMRIFGNREKLQLHIGGCKRVNWKKNVNTVDTDELSYFFRTVP